MSVVSVLKETLREFHSDSRTIGTTAEPLADSQPVKKRLLLKADDANTAGIRIGETAGAAPDGYRLAPGAETRLFVDDVAKVYVVAESGSQQLYWLAF